MSWHFSAALEEAFSEACSSDGAPSAPWRLTPTALDDSCSDKMKVTCHRSPFGTMFVPSTDGPGVELLTLFLEDSRARTLVQRVEGQGLKGNEAGCGRSLLGSLARYDHDSCSWKTPQCSLLGGSDTFSGTWPRWGTMHDGVCWGQSTRAPLTRERDFGLWPTPTTRDRGKDAPNRKGSPSLAVAARTWMTPMASDWKNRGTKEYRKGREVQLQTQVGGQLNPDWVEWLMGWPIGWTASKPLATGRFRQWQSSHGKPCRRGE